ncbi:hypothetical protein [Paenibacillus abyssi]|uniref:Uncharacterized protein n=1 Tax=Paenibacillus abyssi TaxID=1340531 RepID=A0A917D8S5_9BACL|nr:hypothetical protein [Paenibacillus abyssi]GGG13167.1 hypothetical protein GCM10010916_32600 [Paenibacillus abyssi]
MLFCKSFKYELPTGKELIYKCVVRNKNKKNAARDRHVKGNELIQVQLADVYMAGTSDGVQQLGNRKIKLDHEENKQA